MDKRERQYVIMNYKSLTQCEDLRNLHTHLLRLGEDPNEKVSQRAVNLHLLIEKKRVNYNRKTSAYGI